MRKIHIFFTLLAFAMLVSCDSNKSKSSKLVQIDSLLNSGLVDSAYNEIDNIEVKDLQTTADSAYFFLLRTQAEYRLYMPSSSMESLNFSIHYYSNGKAQQEKLAAAYYYKGCFMYDSGDIKNALNYIKTPNSSLKRQTIRSLNIKFTPAYLLLTRRQAKTERLSNTQRGRSKNLSRQKGTTGSHMPITTWRCCMPNLS